jgi:hypothetical protein
MSDTDATTEDATADESTVDETTTDDTEGTEALGDAGKKALDAMKADRNAARKEAREARRLLEDLQAQATRKDDSDKPDLDAIRAEIGREAQTKANERILRSEVKAAAAGKLADPADAYKFLDLTQFEVDADGNVDETEVADAIDDLIKSKPYLAAAQGGKRFQGTADGGTRKETRPSQLTRTDLSGMSPEAIETARVAGRLDDLMSGKSS